MMHFKQNGGSISTIIVLSSISSAVIAQNEAACLFNTQNSEPEDFVNATGTIPLAPWPMRVDGDEWSLTVTFNDSRARNNEAVRYINPVTGYIQGYLTYSKSIRDTTACVYMLPGLNASSTGDSPEASCRGVVSDRCTDAIINATGPVGGAFSPCPSFPTREELAEACPELKSAYGIRSTIEPISLGNFNCTRDLLPGNVSVPAGFYAEPIMGSKRMELSLPTEITEQHMLDFVYYDRFVRQPIPWLIVLKAGQDTFYIHKAQMVCVAPENVTEGSRVPEGEWPPAEGSQQLDENSEVNEGGDNNENSASPFNSGETLLWVLALASVVGSLVM